MGRFVEGNHECPHCGRKFPIQYRVKNPGIASWQGKEYGTCQLMRVHALNNFRKHVKACSAKS